MMFRIQVAEKANPDIRWWEDYDKPDVSDPEAWAREILDDYNLSCAPEKRRVFLSAEIETDPKKIGKSIARSIRETDWMVKELSSSIRSAAKAADKGAHEDAIETVREAVDDLDRVRNKLSALLPGCKPFNLMDELVSAVEQMSVSKQGKTDE